MYHLFYNVTFCLFLSASTSSSSSVSTSSRYQNNITLSLDVIIKLVLPREQVRQVCQPHQGIKTVLPNPLT